MAQKKKVSANLELQSNLAQVNELGYPFSDMQRADFHAMNGFAKLVNKLLTCKSHDDVRGAQFAFRTLWPSVRETFIKSETIMVRHSPCLRGRSVPCATCMRDTGDGESVRGHHGSQPARHSSHVFEV